MIGPTYRSRAAQAVLGPYRSQLIPATLWVGWLDATGAVVGMSGVSVQHDVFGPAVDGVANTVALDCGTAGAGWTISAVGLFDAAAGALIASATLPAPVSPATGEQLFFAVGALLFQVG